MNYVLVLIALFCAVFAEVVALGNKLGSSTWEEWVAGALIAYFLSLLIPWVEARRAPQ